MDNTFKSTILRKTDPDPASDLNPDPYQAFSIKTEIEITLILHLHKGL